MITHDALLAAYDALRPWVLADPPPGLSYEQQGSLLRVVGQHRGFIDTARNVGAQGEALDSLITEQRDFFAQRGEAVEWKTRGHDEPPDLPARLLAAGFVPEDRETVVIGVAKRLAVRPVLPDGVTLRQVHEPSDFACIAAMESEVWNDDFRWMAQDLQARVQAAPDEIVVLVAEADGRVISAAWLVFKPGTEFAGLWGGSTSECVAGARDLPGVGRPACTTRVRSRGSLPAGGRLRRQQAHPAQAWLPGGHDHHPVRLDPQHHGMTAHSVRRIPIRLRDDRRRR